MDWQALIVEAMEKLAKTRPVFHSEADFQHGLAMTMLSLGCTMRLEVPFVLVNPGDTAPSKPRRQAVDMVARRDGSTAAIELKYWKRRAKVEHEGEDFTLSEQGAHDLGRYDFWKDVTRVEGLVKSGQGFAFGCVIALTNDDRYWKPGNAGGLDAEFRMHEDHELRRRRAWKNKDTGTSIGRKDDLKFDKDHQCIWSGYGEIGGQRLRWGRVMVG